MMNSPLPGTGLADPVWLLLLAVVPVVTWLRQRRGRTVHVVPFASRWSGRHGLNRSRLPSALLITGVGLLCIAMARPQRFEERRPERRDGYDILLAIDLSGSMLTEDYERNGRRINRLQAVRPILDAFLARRPDDRIGVVAFGGRAYTLAPLSSDHAWLRRQIARLRVGLIEDGTAVGDALALAVSRLGQAGKEKGDRRHGGFIILLTDGANNAGMEPLEAAELARAKGIPVYTIGAGQDGAVSMPVFDAAGRMTGYRNVASDLDEPTLRGIARGTGGRYYRAIDSSTVNAAFGAIDRERKVEFDVPSNVRTHEYFEYAAWPGVGLCLVAFGLARPGRRGSC